MGRCVKYLVLHKPEGFVRFIMEDYLRKYDFRKVMWQKTEPVYRGGIAPLEYHRFLKWSYEEGVLKLEAWYPGAFGSEKDADANFTYSRKPYEKSLGELLQVLEQELPANTAINQVRCVAMPDYSSSVWVAAFSTGWALFACLKLPFIGILFSLMGYYQAKKALSSSLAHTLRVIARVVRIISLIEVVLFSVMFGGGIVYFVLALSGIL